MAIMTPLQAASALLMDCDGDQRQAEAEAWKRREKFRPEEEGFEFWVKVALGIVEGKEVPKVERAHHETPAPAFVRTGVE